MNHSERIAKLTQDIREISAAVGARKSPKEWGLKVRHEKSEKAAHDLTRLVALWEYGVLDPKLKELKTGMDSALADFAKLAKKFKATGAMTPAVEKAFVEELRKAARRKINRTLRDLGLRKR